MEERILVVDDEKDICDILQFNLKMKDILWTWLHRVRKLYKK